VGGVFQGNTGRRGEAKNRIKYMPHHADDEEEAGRRRREEEEKGAKCVRALKKSLS